MRSYYLLVTAAGLLAFGNAVHAGTRDIELHFWKARTEIAVSAPTEAVNPAAFVQARTS